MIIQTVYRSDFRRAFQNMGRTDQFSDQALDLLFNYFDDLSDEMDEPVELNVIDICCEYTEMTPDEVADQYGFSIDPDSDDGEKMSDALEYLQDRTSVIGQTDSTIVFVQF